jgi:hypothetical protein
MVMLLLKLSSSVEEVQHFKGLSKKSSIFIVKLFAGMPKTFSDTRLNWSCVTRCRCRTSLFGTAAFRYRTVRHYGILINCTKLPVYVGSSVRLQRSSVGYSVAQ